jgi:hypothetical protein
MSKGTPFTREIVDRLDDLETDIDAAVVDIDAAVVDIEAAATDITGVDTNLGDMADAATNSNLSDITTTSAHAKLSRLLTDYTNGRAGYLDELSSANIPADIDTINGKTDSLGAIGVALINSGLAYHAHVTTYTDTTHYRSTTLEDLALGDGYFANWSTYVQWDDGGLGAAPQNETQPNSAYADTDGIVTHTAFSAPLKAGDIVLLLHPAIAALLNATYGLSALADAIAAITGGGDATEANVTSVKTEVETATLDVGDGSIADHARAGEILRYIADNASGGDATEAKEDIIIAALGAVRDTATADSLADIATTSAHAKLSRLLLRFSADAFAATINGTSRTTVEAMAAGLASYITASGAAYSAKVNNNTLRTDLEAILQDFFAVIGCDGTNTFGPSIGGSARTTLETALENIDLEVYTAAHTLKTPNTKIGDIARTIDLLLGARWDATGDLGTDVGTIITAVGTTIPNAIAAIPTTAQRGTDNAFLASVGGALNDAAAEGAVTDADTAMAYIKQLVTAIQLIPTTAMRGTDSAFLASVGGALNDAAAEGAVTDADTAMAYIKQLVTAIQLIPTTAMRGTDSAFLAAVGGALDTSAVYASAADKMLMAYVKGLVDAGIAVAGAVSDAGASDEDFDTNLAEATNDHYNGQLMLFTSGVLKGQSNYIEVYTGASKNCNFIATTGSGNWTEAPGNGDAFIILPDKGGLIKVLYYLISSQITNSKIDLLLQNTDGASSNLAAANVADGSIIAKLASKGANGATPEGFNCTTDSLEAIADRDVDIKAKTDLILPGTKFATKTSTSHLTSADLFTFTGSIGIVSILGRVETAVEDAANNCNLYVTPDALAETHICAVKDINGLHAGTLLTITGTLADAMIGTTEVGCAVSQASMITCTCVTDGHIGVTYGTADKDGVIVWELLWIPLTPGATCVAA